MYDLDLRCLDNVGDTASDTATTQPSNEPVRAGWGECTTGCGCKEFMGSSSGMCQNCYHNYELHS